VFAVHAGGGTSPHPDWNDSFTIQIRSTKRWRVAPNGFMPHPVTNWTIGDPPPLFAHSIPLPTEMPRDAQEYVLTPGSVL
jgi:ribosomal protein L16 Arg81 hydroxylase